MSNNPSIVIGVSAIDTAKDVLTSVDSRIKQTTTNIETEGNKINTKFAQISASIRQNITGIATTAAGLTAGIVGFATSFDTLERSQVGADRAALMYAKSQETLNDMLKSGKASATEIANATEQVRVNSERARLAQDQLGDTYKNFLANVPAQLISFGTSASAIYSMVKAHQLTMAQRVWQIAMGPVGWAILGISTLIVLITTNAFGFRDALYSLGKAVYDFFVQYFKPLADGMKWFYDNVLVPIGNFMGGSAVQSADAYSVSVSNLGVQVQETAVKIKDFDSYMQDLAQDTQDARGDNLLYLASIGKLGDAIGLTNEKLELMTDYLRDVDRENKQVLTSNFKLVTDTYGLQYVLTLENEELELLARNLRVVQEYFDNAAKSATDFKEASKPEETSEDRGNITSEFRATGELAQAREKYPGMALLKIGSNYLPRDLTVAKRQMLTAQDALSSFKRRNSDSWSRSSLERLGELQERAETTRERYEAERITVQNIININRDGSGDVYTQVRDKQNRLLKSSRQVLLGSGHLV